MTVEEVPLRVISPEVTAAVTAPKARIKASVEHAARSRVRTIAATVWADLRDAWFWEAHPPAIADVWRSRTVSYDQIPGGQHECVNVWRPDGGDIEIKPMRRSGLALTCECSDRAPEDRKKFNTWIRTWFAIRWGWIVWNHLVAIPLTVVLYATAWILQHPARTGGALLTLAVMWVSIQAAVNG